MMMMMMMTDEDLRESREGQGRAGRGERFKGWLSESVKV